MILLDKPQYEILDFPVALRPVDVIFNGKPIRQEKVQSVFRGDSKESIDLVSDRYVLIPHGEIFRTLQELVELLPYGCEGVETRLGDRGGYASVEWTFDEKIEVLPGDFVQLTLLGKNSIDRSSALSLELAARRLLCTNGMRGPGPEFKYTWKHREGLIGNNDSLFPGMKDVIERGAQMAKVWREWTEQQINLSEFKLFLEDEGRVLIGKASREKIIDRISWDREGETSLWVGYNALTEHASHHVSTRRNDLLPIRQEQIHQLALRFAEQISLN